MSMTIAQRVRERVRSWPARSFVRSRDLEGSVTAIESALSRLAAEPGSSLVRVRKGLYWIAPTTRFGPVRPRPIDVALEVAGPGAGPAGIAAAAALGLTTQVPSVAEIAVPGRVPKPVPGVRFRQRGYRRREAGLLPLEVAVIEALRAGPAAMEVGMAEFAARVRELSDRGTIRLGRLTTAVPAESDVATRRRFTELLSELGDAAAG